MSNLTIKQKIILGVIIGIMLIVIGIYGYVSLNSEEEQFDIGYANDNQISNIENIEENNINAEKNTKEKGNNVLINRN